jgi:hypothetical protein
MIRLDSLDFDSIEAGKSIEITFEKGVGVIIINPECTMDFIFCKDDFGKASNSAMIMAMIVEVLKNKELMQKASELLKEEAEGIPLIQ